MGVVKIVVIDILMSNQLQEVRLGGVKNEEERAEQGETRSANLELVLLIIFTSNIL